MSLASTASSRRRRILMVGTGLQAHGGITAVIRSYLEVGLFEQWGVRYVSTYEGKGKLTQLRTIASALCRITGLLAARRVDVVHVHSASRGSFWRKSLVAALAFVFRVPYVFHLHSGEFPDFYAHGCGPLARAWVRLVLRRAARVVVVAPRWRADVLRIEPAARVAVVGNPVRVPPLLAPLRPERADGAATVLFLGRLHEKKGIFDLVRAMPAVLSVLPATTFVFAGDGETEAIRALATEQGVAHALRLPGWVDGAAKQQHLEQADLFVLPTYFEALGVALLEAMACGVPVIATPVGGIPDFIDDGVEALLVPPGPGTALAAAIVAALQDRALRSRLREQAFARVAREYAFDAVLGQLRAIYAELGVPLGPATVAPAAARTA
ncbi:glycosyltransferase family 4 protein [Pseudoduganella aquatica]|nr:glycosyltransferase family 4 protein [Pseudoduganella aquatica]